MRSVTTASLVVVMLAMATAHASAAAVNHECIHDSPDLQREHARLKARNGAAVQSYAPSVHTEGGRLFHAKQAQPIRIVFSFDDLTETGAFCSSTSGTAPSYRTGGGTVACSLESYVLTDAKRAILRDNILPAAVTKLQRYLSVQPVVGTLRASSTTVCGDEFTVPVSHATTGVADADLVIYVASSPIPGATVAFAGACQDDQNGRAVFGRMNFGTENIEWTDAATQKSLVDTAVHEVLHVLGITSSEFFVAGRSTTATKRGKTVRMVSTPTVRDFARTFSGCATLEGAEVEDEQTSGPEGSHWERKLYFDEVMAASGGGASALSGLTLGFLQDINVGYTVTLTGADNMAWGAQDGCGPYDNKCNTAAGLRDKYFCFDDPAALSNKCTWNLQAIGTCQVESKPSAFPSYFQYYSSPNVGGNSFMDGCPHVQEFSNRVCNVEKAETDNDIVFGYNYSPTSRCYQATGVIQSGFTSSAADGPRCLQTQCSSSNAVSFRVGPSSSSASFTSCPSAGTTRPAGSGYDGNVVCPDPTDMCTSLSGAAATAAPTTTAGPTTPVPTNADGSTPSPPPTTTTTAPTTTAAPASGGGGGITVGGVTVGSSSADLSVTVGVFLTAAMALLASCL